VKQRTGEGKLDRVSKLKVGVGSRFSENNLIIGAFWQKKECPFQFMQCPLCAVHCMTVMLWLSLQEVIKFTSCIPQVVLEKNEVQNDPPPNTPLIRMNAPAHNKKLRYREEQSVSVVFSWCTLRHISGENRTDGRSDNPKT